MADKERENILQTKKYFDSWRSYQKEVGTDFAELYANCGSALDKDLGGCVLDVGSGGIFNYHQELAQRLVAVDYSVGAIDLRAFPPNSVLVQGDGTRLPFRSATFDCVVLQFLIHHLALHSHAQTVHNVQRCLEESHRVLRPGGKLLVVESCVPRLLEWGERLLYPVTRRLLKLTDRPMVFQFSVTAFHQIMKSKTADTVGIHPISIGKFISQFGLKVPGWLSPCQIRLFKAVKPA